MAKVVDYYLIMISPWAYLGGPRLEEIARRRGAEVRVKPFDASVVFPATGGLPLAKRAPARQAYRLAELRRWRDHLAMPLTVEPAHFPAAHETSGTTSRRRNSRTASRAHKNWPVRFTERTKFQS